MRHGLVYIYSYAPAIARFDELLRQIEFYGLFLAHPATGRVIRLGLPGQQIVTTGEELRQQFTHCPEVAFIFYLNSSTSVVSSWLQLAGGIWREAYSLDGNTEQESHLVIDMLTDLFRQRAARGTAFAFVADRYAELHRDFQWDDFVIGDALPPEWPMRIGLSGNPRKIDKIPTQIYDSERTDAYALFRKKATD